MYLDDNAGQIFFPSHSFFLSGACLPNVILIKRNCCIKKVTEKKIISVQIGGEEENIIFVVFACISKLH